MGKQRCDRPYRHPTKRLASVGLCCTLPRLSGKLHWVEASAGDLVEIPANAKHAFRNRSQNPMLNLLFTTSKLRPTIDRYRPKKSAIQAMNASSTL
jgi:oxalate decarboxylase/phosphoglucose isomerase-like protein (cupin superfamily)